MRQSRIWVLVSLAWAGPAFFAALRSFIERASQGERFTWRNFVWEAGDWLLYGLLTPGVFWLARRFPLTRGRLAKHIPLHLLASLVFCAAWAAGGIWLHNSLFGSGPYGQGFGPWFVGSWPFGIAVYFAVLGAEHAAFYFFESRERETQAARLASPAI